MTASADAKSEPKKSSEADVSAHQKARLEKAHSIVHQNMYWALGLGFVPIPLLDLAAVTAVQVRMLKSLSDLYGVNFAEDKAKTVIASLVAGLGGLTIASAIATSLFRIVPLVGQVVGFVGGPALAGALTVAVGNMFTMHYEAGGTLLDFDAEKMRAHFRHEFEKGKETARNAHDRGRVERPAP